MQSGTYRERYSINTTEYKRRIYRRDPLKFQVISWDYGILLFGEMTARKKRLIGKGWKKINRTLSFDAGWECRSNLGSPIAGGTGWTHYGHTINYTNSLWGTFTTSGSQAPFVNFFFERVSGDIFMIGNEGLSCSFYCE